MLTEIKRCDYILPPFFLVLTEIKRCDYVATTPKGVDCHNNLQTQSPLSKILLVDESNYMPPNLNLQHAVSVVVMRFRKSTVIRSHIPYLVVAKLVVP